MGGELETDQNIPVRMVADRLPAQSLSASQAQIKLRPYQQGRKGAALPGPSNHLVEAAAATATA
jgi:hypothetical protein